MTDSLGDQRKLTGFIRIRLIWFSWIFAPYAVAFIGAQSAPINSLWVAAAWLIAALVCVATMQYLRLTSDDLRLLRPPTLRQAVIGIAIAAANFAVLCQLFTFMTGTTILWSGLYQERIAIAIAIALFSGVHEEVLYRLALFAILLRRFTFHVAIFLQALIFTLMHFGTAFIERAPLHFASGLVFGLVAVRYGIVSSIAAHGTWNGLILMFQGGVGPGYRLYNLWLNSEFQALAPAIVGISWFISALILWVVYPVRWAAPPNAIRGFHGRVKENEMSNALGIPKYRRVIGVAIVASGLVLASVALMYADYLEDLYTGPLTVSIFGVVMILAGTYLVPFVLYPCIYDRFPAWVQRLPIEKVTALKALLGVK